MYMRGIRTIMNIAKTDGTIREGAYLFGKGRYEIKASVGRKKALSSEQLHHI